MKAAIRISMGRDLLLAQLLLSLETLWRSESVGRKNGLSFISMASIRAETMLLLKAGDSSGDALCDGWTSPSPLFN